MGKVFWGDREEMDKVLESGRMSYKWVRPKDRGTQEHLGGVAAILEDR